MEEVLRYRLDSNSQQGIYRSHLHLSLLVRAKRTLADMLSFMSYQEDSNIQLDTSRSRGLFLP